MESWQITVLISVVALLVSTVTAAVTMIQTAKRDRFRELDIICKQQWTEINVLHTVQRENVGRFERCEKDREDLKFELKTLREKSDRDVATMRTDIAHANSQAKDNAMAQALVNAANAQAIAANTAEKINTDASLTQIKNSIKDMNNTVEITHKIVNTQRTKMLKLIAEQASRIANENSGDEAAQIASKKAAQDLEDNLRQYQDFSVPLDDT